MSTRLRIPKYRHHKARNQAVVRLDGKDHYLGPYDSPASREKYHRLVAEHISRQGSPVIPTAPGQPLTVQRLTLAYTDYAESYYLKEGKVTSEVACIEAAVRPLLKLYARTPAAEFGPKALKLVREEFIRKGLVRGTVNHNVFRVRRMFRWAVENEFLPVSVYQALMTVTGLRKGRSPAPEPPPVRPVEETAIQAALPFMPAAVAAMVQLQLLTGCRPGEICRLRPGDIDRSREVWCYRPASHKCEHHELEKRIFLGPKAQTILQPWLERPADAYCFSPTEMRERQRQERHARRKTPLKYGNRPGTNRKKKPKCVPGQRYRCDTYRQAIVRACEAANIRPWCPRQLRHTRATDLRSQYGLDAAQVVLGHTQAFVTQIYAERDFKKAEEVMRQVS